MAAGDVTAKRTNYSDYPCNVFDGVDDYVEIPHNAAQLGANLANGFTISAWINPRSAGEGAAAAAGFILSKEAVGANGFTIYQRQDNSKLAFSINGGTALTSTAALTYRVWAHILITVSAAQLANFYKNAVLASTANVDLVQTIAAITSTSVMRIGNRSLSTDRTFDGSIRSVKMWNRVLTTAEIAADYAGHNAPTAGLIHYFKLGGDYKDYGSVGVDATNSGSVANTTIPELLRTDAHQLNLAAVTDNIIALPVEGRDGVFVMVGANRTA